MPLCDHNGLQKVQFVASAVVWEHCDIKIGSVDGTLCPRALPSSIVELCFGSLFASMKRK